MDNSGFVFSGGYVTKEDRKKNLADIMSKINTLKSGTPP